jgi:GTP-binding protein Era
MTRAGIITLAGMPNAGKSTLLNRLVGEKLGIVSPKPQSTRTRIVGIVTRDDSQMVLLDTPGLLEPAHLLHKSMRQAALAAIAEADVIVHLVDAGKHETSSLVEAARLDQPPRAPVITLFNKIDSLSAPALKSLEASHPDAILVSARTGEGIDKLLAALAQLLPEAPFLYPADDLSTQSTRFFVTELIRESALEQLEQEVPYALACEIEEFREGTTPLYIRAVLHVERKSQKGIVVGAGGSRIREIGSSARRKIEQLLGVAVYLDLWVKVLPDWSRNQTHLKRLGYNIREDDPQ